ncbi:PhnD/SsuA/transferrin family substrate-binding protein [Sulfurimonas aquatica]|uniref:PhnD/SsuA/transferrin family substrate-binding protein n=1 Tax=Sulfurimonas aquatica TaxID=2672570 RepID=A0A975AYL7_9BACT|nr:PhnD/SsuA/transferrin family substrate-binding protein [Sulfurimonas aquatica]QSZ40996.1 PhnD/SsuA/transferrin family substrate-binding protein [Sulfurimonas aquatica]
MLKNLFLFSFIFTLFIGNSLVAKEESTKSAKATMGYLVEGLHDIKFKDARIAFSLWIKELSINEDMDVGIKYYENEEECIEDFESASFEYLALNAYFYLKHQSRIDANAKEYWVATKSEKRFTNRVILVNKKSGIKSLKDLKNRTVMSREDDYLGRLVLDKELLEELGADSSSFFKSSLKSAKSSTAILKVYFSTVDACVVPEYMFKFMQEMNPKLSSELSVLKRTPDIFLPVMAVFHKTTPTSSIDSFHRNVATLESTPRGQNILALFKMHKMRVVDVKEFDGLREYYQEYLHLSKAYKKSKTGSYNE